MIIYHLSIKNFRGIKELDWHLGNRVLCLVGPGNATKSTILEAISLVTTSKATASFNDNDFFKGETSCPLKIEATIGELPENLLDEVSKFGLYLKGYDEVFECIVDSPLNGISPALTIRLEVGDDLEPIWSVVKDEVGPPRRISARDRGLLSVHLLGENPERSLTWSRGSALSRLTEDDGSSSKLISAVSRQVNEAVRNAPNEELHEAARQVRQAALPFGVDFRNLSPGFDGNNFSFSASSLGLQENAVPLRLWGNGTKRLASMAIQQHGNGADSVVLIDELEIGLEPYRIRHLVKCLSMPNGTKRSRGQVIFTTHSPSSIIPLDANSLRFVSSKNGITSVLKVKPADEPQLQGYIRSHSHAFLAKRLVACEGATEVGICRGLSSHWASLHEDKEPAHVGCEFIDGGGNSKVTVLSMALNNLGYAVAVLADSDKPISPPANTLEPLGIKIIQWSGQVATELRLALDVPPATLQKLLDFAIEERSPDTVFAHVKLYGGIDLLTSNLDDAALVWSDAEIRQAIGNAAQKGEWFKTVGRGERVGEIIADALIEIPETQLALQLSSLTDWIYSE